MRLLPVLVVIGLTSIALAGCLGPGPVVPEPSTGGWTTTSATPYFARVGHAGMCDMPPAPCQHATVLYTFGHVLWFSYARNLVYDEENQTMVERGLEVPNENYRATIAKALEVLGEEPGQYVSALTTATMTKTDADAVQHRFFSSAVGLTDPGPVGYVCEDAGEPRLVFLVDPHLDAHVADRTGECGTNESPQEGWFRIREQADAANGWIAPEPWTLAEGVVGPRAMTRT